MTDSRLFGDGFAIGLKQNQFLCGLSQNTRLTCNHQNL